MRCRAPLGLLVGLGVAFGAWRAHAEPVFLSRQYTRCTTCHYSPTGGGLLTPYGRSLSREELSSMGGSLPASQTGPGHEQDFLWGVLGDRLGPVSLGLDVRPAHLSVGFPGGDFTRNLLMTADLLAAYQVKGWTVYGEIGRQPRSDGTRIDSYEYWVGHQTDRGLGFRVGRFLPAYGVRLADHTALTRAPLGLDAYDQVLGFELSHASERHLLQLSLSPGRGDAVFHDDGTRAFTATGRFQVDLGPRSVLVVSGLFRDAARLQARNGAGGVAFGYAPTSRLSVWSEADVQVRQGASGAPAYALLNETGFEVFRGVWLKVSPQLRTELGDTSAGVLRLAFELNLLPRTHWNVDVSFYRDRDRSSDAVARTLLAQLHLYL